MTVESEDKERMVIYSNRLYGAIPKLQEDLKKAEEEISSIKEVKSQIFVIMAMFFGIFSFVSVSLTFNITLLKDISNINPWVFMGLFIFSQGMFFVAIYFCILRPFFGKKSENHNKLIAKHK